ncbi:DegT/DnrJ/EryC1/StrS family aminotransferase [Gloeobacter kilaueensis]|uniref:DegT/DnrJ/EryC1/StrS aminotransferase n=1 Tax=Gloeobacter kilaueensis (strain ATCC BAA-2537 / CCAP 1431/1 / ULC 316 / JS1) TaxID=1183438 RepID=U5QGB9_GLOK1|nr:DegT/DnrJ/EryC1/StrS family aminotransferase [Gloeobacter kilaueensis]AGY56715.1 DegT/DnrJ/EryC1/StrS aminotransferase [Gloeobacter kilaueensis JS1]
MIPMLDLQAQYWALADELNAAVQRTMAAGQYILGPEVKKLEADIARYCGTRFAVGVNSGTDALYLALRALEIGPGDEVITTPFTFIATTEAIGAVGATPVFVDIDPHTFNLDVAQVEAKITPQTRALLPVHLYGQTCEMDSLVAIARRHGLRIVEDCAQAIGASWRGQAAGALGDIGCFSFFPSKNLGCYGDGGMAVTSDPVLAERIEILRRHGGKKKYHHTELGVNSRLDELQAAILNVKFPHLDAWNAARRERARTYNQLLAGSGIACPGELADSECVYHQYTVRVPDRERVQAELKAAGVASMVYYPIPLHLQEVHRNLGYGAGDFPVAEQAAREVLSLPIYPEISFDEQSLVAQALIAAVRQPLAV